MSVFAGAGGARRLRAAGAGWYADLLARAVADGVAGARRLTARAAVPDMHHVTLRQAFPAGVVPAGWHVEPRVAVDLPVLDWDQQTIATHPDGSLAEAAVTLLLPPLAPGDEIVVEFRPRQGPPPAEPTALWPEFARAARPPVTEEPILGYREPDLTAAVAAELAPGEWRRISLNRYRDIVRRPAEGGFDPYYWHAGKTDEPLNDTNRLPFAYSSGVFLPERRKYVFTGGGHGDWLGSEIGVFDYRTRRWHRTEDSARYVVGHTGAGAPVEPDLFDPTAPVQATPHGSRYHYPWPNIRGRHAPLSTHTYCGVAHMPDRGRLYVYGGAGFPGGSAKPGGIWVIDDRDFRWRGAETIATDSNGYNAWTQSLGDGRLFTYNGQDGVVRVFDVAETRPGRIADGRSGVRATYTSPSSALIREAGADGPAYLTWAAGKTPQLVICRRFDGPGGGTFERLDGATPLPPGVTTTASWLHLGEHLPGSTAIAAYQRGVGLFTLDSRTLRWAGPFDTAEGRDGRPPDRPAWKGFGYLPAYDCFSVVYEDGVWLCRRPPDMG